MNTQLYSGGGFSNYWPAPSYQSSTLAKYFANSPPPYDNLTAYGTPYYNKTGRGYPDVAAVGLNILLYSECSLIFRLDRSALTKNSDYHSSIELSELNFKKRILTKDSIR